MTYLKTLEKKTGIHFLFLYLYNHMILNAITIYNIIEIRKQIELFYFIAEKILISVTLKIKTINFDRKIFFEYF